MTEPYKPVNAVREEAMELLTTPLGSLEMAIKYVEGHHHCQSALRNLDRTYEKLTMLGSELSEKAAKFVFNHADELGVKIVPHRPGIRYAVIKNEKYVYVVVETALESDKPPAYLWCRPYRFLSMK